MDQESIEKKRGDLFSRIIAGNSANDFSLLKILHRVIGLHGRKLSVCNFKADTLKLLRQTLRVAKMVLVFYLLSKKQPSAGSRCKVEIFLSHQRTGHVLQTVN